jgi:AcrR family transcriptional regulator
MPRKKQEKPSSPALNRRQRAVLTRRRMHEAAYAAFCEHGYRATTMNEVAVRADVAVQTVYFTFHTKAALLTEVVVGVSGGPDAGTPVMERAWIKEAMAARDAQRALALIVEHGTEIFRRLAPLWDTMVSASAEDPDFAARFNDIVSARRRGMRVLIDAIAAKGGLVSSPETTADTLFLLNSPQLFTMATQTLGWSVERFKAWSFRTLLTQLKSHAWRAATTADLSYHGELLQPAS